MVNVIVGVAIVERHDYLSIPRRCMFTSDYSFGNSLLFLCMLDNSACFCRLMIFLKINFFKKNISVRNTTGVSNSLDPDQVRPVVEPNLGPERLQRLSADERKCGH